MVISKKSLYPFKYYPISNRLASHFYKTAIGLKVEKKRVSELLAESQVTG
jgi:hypothetical protein